MSALTNLTFTICVVMIISSLLKIVFPNNDISRQLKVIVTLFVIVTIFTMITSSDFTSLKKFLDSSSQTEASTEKLWDNSCQIVEEQLEKQFLEYAVGEGLSVESINVSVSYINNEFEIDSVEIAGDDAESAKDLIAGHFQTQLSIIKVINDE